ncbi:hypothetical protein ACRCUN_12865 [Mycobacterium sp. LTG2003]
MTMATLTGTATVHDVIFDGVRGDPVDVLAKSLHEHDTVEPAVSGIASLTAPARHAVERAVADEVGELLDLDLRDLAVAGWNRYGDLMKAARRSRDTPKSKEYVSLATHQITSSHRPTVEVFINGTSAAVIDVKLDVTFEMAGVVAVVQDARLIEVQSGNCTVTATLAVGKAVVAKRQRQFDVPGAIRLKNGVALLRTDAQRTEDLQTS